MSSHIITKILSVLGLAALTVLPVQETVYARSVSGGGTGSTNTSGTYQVIWNGPLYSQITGGSPDGGAGSGSSLIPGGYQYDPSRGVSGGGISGGGRTITGGGTSNGGRGITGGGSSGSYGSSLIPGGYQYDPSRGVSGGGISGGGRTITGGGTTNGGRGITGGGTTSCGYGSSLIPGGYQYCPSPEDDTDNDNDNNDDQDNDDSDVSPVEETTYYACDDNSETMYMKVTQDGKNYTIRLYEEGEKGSYYISDEMTGEEVAEFIADKQEDYDCYRISRSKFEDRLQNDNDNDDDGEKSTCKNRPYPDDIDGHWSEIYVRRLYDLCVIEGYNDGSFRPNQYVTRAELVKMGLYANGLKPNEGCYDNDCGSPYNDLDEWQGPWIRTAYDRDIVEGYANEKFYPNRNITREEAVKVVLATYGYSPINVSKSFFNDVSGWSTGWIERAHEIGMVQGIGNGNFDPQRPITRAEAAKIIVKMIEHWDTEIK